MLPTLTGPGGYVTSGTVVSDTFPSVPAVGSTLVAVTMSNSGGTARGALDGTGWAVMTNPAGALAEFNELTYNRIVTFWTKQAGATEPTTVTYTGPLGGTHAIKLYSFAQTGRIGANLIRTASSAGTNTYGLDMGSTTSTSADAFAVAGVIANGGLTGTAISDGFTLAENNARAAIAEKAVGAIVVAPDWSITTAARGLTSVLAVLYAAEKPVVTMGVDKTAQTNQEVTIAVSVTKEGTGPGASPYTYEIEQTAGTAVTLAGTGNTRTFTTTTDGTRTFRGRAIGTGGLASDYDSVNVVVTVGNSPPQVTVTVSPTAIFTGEEVVLSATATDSDGNVASGQWTAPVALAAVSFDDAASATTSTSELTAASPYTFRYTATDNEGATGFAEVSITPTVPVGVPTLLAQVVTAPPEGGTVRPFTVRIVGAKAGEIHRIDAVGLAPGAWPSGPFGPEETT